MMISYQELVRTFLNILLTLLGYIPGLIHAFWVQTRD